MRRIRLFIILVFLLSFTAVWAEDAKGHNYNYKTDILITFYHEGGLAYIYCGDLPVKNVYVDGKCLTPSDINYPSRPFSQIARPLKKGFHSLIYELKNYCYVDGSPFPDDVYELQLPECVSAFSTNGFWGNGPNSEYKFVHCGTFAWYNRGSVEYGGIQSIGDQFGVEAYNKTFYCFSSSFLGWVDVCEFSQRLRQLGFDIQHYADEDVPKGNQVRQILMNPQNPTLRVGDRMPISVSFSEYNNDYAYWVTNPNLSWKSSNEEIATVSQDGVVTAKKPGSVAILATALDGSNVKAINKITVVPENTSLYDYKNDVMLICNVADWTKIFLKDEYTPDDFKSYAVYVDGNLYPDISEEYLFSPGKHTIIYKGKDQKTFSFTQFEKIGGCIVELRIPQSIEQISGVFGPGRGLEQIYCYGLTAPSFIYTWGNAPFSKELGTGTTDKCFYTLENAKGYDEMPWDTLRVLNYFTYNIKDSEANQVYKCKSIHFETSTLTMSPGDSYVVQANVLPQDAVDKKLIWSSSNESIASVSVDGRVTAHAEGNVNITARTKDGSNVSETMAVSVKAPVASVDYDPYNDIMFKCYAPEANKELSMWSTYAPDLSDIEKNKDAISAIYVDGKLVPFATKMSFDYVGVHTVVVKLQGKFDGLSISNLNGEDGSVRLLEGHQPTNFNVYIGSNCYYCDRMYIYKSIYPSWYPDGCGLRSHDNKIFIPTGSIGYESLNNGNFVVEFMDVPVQKVEDFFVNYENMWLNIGEKSTPTVTFYPSTAVNKKITWTSKDTKVVTVDENGVVTGVGDGRTFVVAKAEDGSGVTKTIEFVVKKQEVPVTSIAVDKSELNLEVNETAELKAIITPSYATNQEVKWTSSDEDVVYIDQNSGFLMALSEGKATISVSTTDGSSLTATCEVTVTPSTGISNASVDQFKVMVNNRTLTISGLDDKTPITVVSLQGSLVYKGMQHSCKLPGSGIYIVKAQGKEMKIAVK